MIQYRRMAHSPAGLRRSGLGAALLLAACQHAPADTSPQPATVTADKVWFLEASGTPVADSAVTFAAAEGRVVVMRHLPPDDAMFVVLQFPPSVDPARAHDTVHVTIRPTAGAYGFLLTTSDRLPSGTQATFSYAVHFQTPLDAAVKYPSPGRFELLVIPALLGPDRRVQFLAGLRPAADMLRFPVAIAGSYALVVPR